MSDYRTLREIIEKDPHVVRVELGEPWKFLIINNALFRSNKDTVLLYFINLQKFLGLPYIVDDFENHGLRELWRLQEVPRKYDKDVQEFLRNNSLRTASYMVVNHCTDVINPDNYVGTNKEMFESKLKEMLDGISQIREVTKGDRPTPVTLVKSLKQIVYSLLEFLSYQSPTT